MFLKFDIIIDSGSNPISKHYMSYMKSENASYYLTSKVSVYVNVFFDMSILKNLEPQTDSKYISPKMSFDETKLRNLIFTSNCSAGECFYTNSKSSSF